MIANLPLFLPLCSLRSSQGYMSSFLKDNRGFKKSPKAEKICCQLNYCPTVS